MGSPVCVVTMQRINKLFALCKVLEPRLVDYF